MVDAGVEPDEGVEADADVGAGEGVEADEDVAAGEGVVADETVGVSFVPGLLAAPVFEPQATSVNAKTKLSKAMNKNG